MVWNDGPSLVDWLELKLLHTVVLACCLPPGLSFCFSSQSSGETSFEANYCGVREDIVLCDRGHMSEGTQGFVFGDRLLSSPGWP